MANLSIAFVGGRPVVASGSVVLNPHDVTTSIFLEELMFQVTFVQIDGQPTLKSEIMPPTTMNFVISGSLQSVIGGIAWNLLNIATFQGKPLHLMLHVSAVGEQFPVRIVNFTFSSGAV